MIQQTKFTYFLLENHSKTIEDQVEKQTKTLESVNFFNKMNELQQAKDMILDNHLANLVNYGLKEIIKLQNSMKINFLKLFINKKELEF